MRLLSVNIGKAQRIKNAGKFGETVLKQPTTIPVLITFLDLAGDEICATSNRGGANQAVYLYGSQDYAWWANEFRYMPAPGAFGENLTLSDLESAKWRNRCHYYPEPRL